ncbi:ABC transporter permease [Chitinophaga tropicalis]|uniref:FtsX-like permease family protein n=1 Tax=Chitinophaga tropicalis TaxID=2683588 RepID=A0A7K1U2R0_9BACT|nr:ABC transporter permease [Chitinophaga tropicalis]MVT08295.1 FtsX-like permease family protein [Chitinophaga tropicalis]
MIANHLKIALKHFKRHKLFTLINIIGLSIGISASLIIFLIVNHDFSFDRFHPDQKRIYRVVTNYDFSGEKVYNMGVSAPLPQAIRQEVTGVEKVAPFITLYDMDVKVPTGGTAKTFKRQQQIILAENNYFDVFRYKWLAGSVKGALTQPNAVVVTSDKATQYFPGLSYADIIGRTLIYDDSINLQVTGVVAPFRENTDLKFSDFISLSTLTITKKISDNLGFELTNWGGTSSASQCYVKLSTGADPAVVERAITAIALKYNPPKPDDVGSTRKFGLQPLSDVHFNALYGNYQGNHIANRKTLYSLLTIAAFLLILGCINFINLSTAQSSQRAKEIGIRKTIGSTRGQLVGQLLTETFLVTLIAVGISVSLAPSLLKIFSDFIAPEIHFNPLQQPEILLFLIALIAVVSLLAGFYPSMVLSAFKPVTILKNHTENGNTRNMWLRKSLTVSQFVIAQFFIIATIMVSKQTRYVLNRDLGFKKDAIVFMNTPWKNNTESKKQVLADKLRQIPQISMISRGGVPPSSYQTSSTDAEFYDGRQNIKLQLYLKFADEDYISLYGIKLLAGRNIRKSDSSAFVINQTYSRLLGFKNPTDALGKYIEKFNGDKRMQIVGVVADFRQESLHNAVKPMAIMISNEAWNSSVFHIALRPQTPGGEEWKTAISAISKAWKEIYPDDEFNYNFYDESIARFYESEQRSSRLLAWASGLSILISCLGLLGLAIYSTSLRTKEVGVRKVLGATVMQIVTLLSMEMINLVLLSFIIVTPVAWWAMNSWMQSFADRTSISWWIFVLSGMGMLFTALLTLSSQTIRIALNNPIKSLRSE